MSRKHFDGVGPCLNVDDCWLISVVVAEGWGGSENLLKQDNNEKNKKDMESNPLLWNVAGFGVSLLVTTTL